MNSKVQMNVNNYLAFNGKRHPVGAAGGPIFMHDYNPDLAGVSTFSGNPAELFSNMHYPQIGKTSPAPARVAQ